jgi:tetratricopeptide (TPR) repeat protein
VAEDHAGALKPMSPSLSKGPGASLVGSPCGACPSSEQIVAELLDRKELIQDYEPVERSLDWLLGQLYYRQRGNSAFLSGEVPYVINNDGFLSQQAAELLITSLAESDEGTGPIVVVEFGAGSGLFARLFLDCFRDLCGAQGTDYYRRLRYYVTDASPRMVEDWGRLDLFAPHKAVCRLSVADAMLPQLALGSGEKGQRIKAIFANYTLDSLPATVLRFPSSGYGKDIERLYTRTRLTRRVKLEDFTSLSFGEVRAAASQSPESLIDLYPLLSLDYEFREAEADEVPFAAEARALTSGQAEAVVSSYGAAQALARMFSLLGPGGFVLVNDYASSAQPAAFIGTEHSGPYQRFGGSTSIGLNFPFLERCCRLLPGGEWLQPVEEHDHLHSRLLLAGQSPATAQQFSIRFGKTLFDWVRRPADSARELARQGRPEVALAEYREALVRQPRSWALHNELAQFLVNANEPEAAQKLAEASVRLNPISPEAWNILGDALWAQAKWDEAHLAFLQALHVYPADIRGRHNLVYTFGRKGDFRSALQMIGEALLLDVAGAYRERLLERQAEILSRLSRRSEIQNRIMSDRAFLVEGSSAAAGTEGLAQREALSR